jgi:hypothetical protein
MNTLIKRFLVGVFGRDRISFDDSETPWQPLVTDGAVTQGLHWERPFLPACVLCMYNVPVRPNHLGARPFSFMFSDEYRLLSSIKDRCSKYTTIETPQKNNKN